jgi:hypothetical protein
MQQYAELLSPVNATALRADQDAATCQIAVSFDTGLPHPFKLYLDHGNSQSFKASTPGCNPMFDSVEIHLSGSSEQWDMSGSGTYSPDLPDGIACTVVLQSEAVSMTIENRNSTGGTIVLTAHFVLGGPDAQLRSIDPQIVLPPQG